MSSPGRPDLASELSSSDAWRRHREIVARAFDRNPDVDNVEVADLEPKSKGYFEPATRTLCLDCRVAGEAIEHGASDIEPTLLHELIHAVQDVGDTARLTDFELHLLEGSTDAVAAQLHHEHSPTTTHMTIAGRHGPVYGPFEAATLALVRIVTDDDPARYVSGLIEYAKVPAGRRFAWLAQGFGLRRYQRWARRRLRRALKPYFAIPPPAEYVGRVVANWETEAALVNDLSGLKR